MTHHSGSDFGQVGGKWHTPCAVACLTHLFPGPQWWPDPLWVCEAHIGSTLSPRAQCEMGVGTQ